MHKQRTIITVIIIQVAEVPRARCVLRLFLPRLWLGGQPIRVASHDFHFRCCLLPFASIMKVGRICCAWFLAVLLRRFFLWQLVAASTKRTTKRMLCTGRLMGDVQYLPTSRTFRVHPSA